MHWLTRRHLDILAAVCHPPGATYAEAGAALGISGATVKNLLSRIYALTGLRNIGAACYAYCLEVERDERVPAMHADEV